MNKRVKSIDIIRGFAVALMMIVNTPGSWKSNFPQLSHAPWHGVTIADFAFPFFIISLGVAVPISINNKISKGKSDTFIILDIIKRSIILFLFGLGLNFISNRDLGTIRVMGVLQRLAIVYLSTSILYIVLVKITSSNKIRIVSLLCIAMIIIVGYYSVSIPFGFEEQGNLAGIIDAYILQNHLYTPTFDPEGVVTTIVSISSGILGCLVGCIIIQDDINQYSKFRKILAIGILCLGISIVFNKNFPFNKRLWSSSFILITMGAYSIVLSWLYFICDIKEKYKIFNPAIALGSSPIFIYMISEIINRTNILTNIKILNVDSIMFICIYLTIWTLTTLLMHKNEIYIRI